MFNWGGGEKKRQREKREGERKGREKGERERGKRERGGERGARGEKWDVVLFYIIYTYFILTTTFKPFPPLTYIPPTKRKNKKKKRKRKGQRRR